MRMLILLVLACLGDAFAWRLQSVQAGFESALSSIFSLFHGDDHDALLRHPADWSRNVFPVNIHSHNDEWRDVPVLNALALGVRSIEHDVYYNPTDDTLYVGHDPFSLSRKRTFDRLTLQPMRAAIDQANAANHRQRISGQYAAEASLFAQLQRDWMRQTNGTFSTFAGYFSMGLKGLNTQLQLYIDVKTNYTETLPKIVESLQDMATKGYLTQIDTVSNKTTLAPLVVITGGVTKIADLLALPSPRFLFADCPLGFLDKDVTLADGTSVAYDPSICGQASNSLANITDWLGLTDISAEQRSNLSGVIEQAHARNIPTRVWATPNWPVYARNAVNRELLALGSDWINADYLDEVVKSF